MKARYWSLTVVLILINYLIFATLFTKLLETNLSTSYVTPVPIPTFTPAPAQPYIVVSPIIPPTVPPTATATRVLQPANANRGAEVPTLPPEQRPHLVAPGTVNIRSGPGLNYEIIGVLNANSPIFIVGRNAASSWWQIKISGNKTGWVSNSVVNARNTEAVPIAEAVSTNIKSAPVPQPAAINRPSPLPKQQYSPTGWHNDTNGELTRFSGDIVDTNGSPVNGAFVQASCGDYSTISFPSGVTGWGDTNETADWSSGFYDIIVDAKPVPCVWILTVVDTDDRKTVKAKLSESIPVEVTIGKSIIVANWRKNW